MPLVDRGSVFEQTFINDLDRAEEVARFGPQAEERMRDVLTADKDRDSPLIDWFGEETRLLRHRDRGDIYQNIVDQVSPWDSDDKDRLKRAETLWALAEALPHLNVRVSDSGGLISEEGFQENTTRLKSESQVAQTQQGIRTQALRIARGLLSRHDRKEPSPVYIL